LKKSILALFDRRGRSQVWSLLGQEPTWSDVFENDANDPERHFSTVNYCIAKGTFDHLVGEQLHAPNGEPSQQPCCCRCKAGARANFLTLFVNGDLFVATNGTVAWGGVQGWLPPELEASRLVSLISIDRIS
jgi:hypothetical protein